MDCNIIIAQINTNFSFSFSENLVLANTAKFDVAIPLPGSLYLLMSILHEIVNLSENGLSSSFLSFQKI